MSSALADRDGLRFDCDPSQSPRKFPRSRLDRHDAAPIFAEAGQIRRGMSVADVNLS